jgi:hypothetical protein
MIDKCLEVYHRIQQLAPGDVESTENIRIVKGDVSAEQAYEYFKAGEHVVAALLLGYHLENRLRAFTVAMVGRSYPTLSEGLKEMQQRKRLSRHKKDLFSDLVGIRNKAIHQPTNIAESDFQMAIKKLAPLEEAVP